MLIVHGHLEEIDARGEPFAGRIETEQVAAGGGRIFVVGEHSHFAARQIEQANGDFCIFFQTVVDGEGLAEDGRLGGHLKPGGNRLVGCGREEFLEKGDDRIGLVEVEGIERQARISKSMVECFPMVEFKAVGGQALEFEVDAAKERRCNGHG